VAANCDGQLTRSAADIRKKLVTQIDHPVFWEDSMSLLIKEGGDNFVELGSGRVLCGLLRRIDKTKKFANIEDKKSADTLLNPVKA
jgi:[acyl-carrier-protein] S-malonyltransferase